MIIGKRVKKRENRIYLLKNKLSSDRLISFLSIIFSVFLFWIMMISHFWFLIWICFAPAFFVIKRERIIPLFLFCILFVVLLNISCFYWFTRYEMKLLFISIFLMGIFGFFLCIFSKLFSFNRILRTLIIPILWTCLVLLFSFNPLGSAWVNFAFFWPMMAPLIWYVKGIGITFLIILSNSLIAEYFFEKNKKILFALGILFLIVVLCFFYSYYGQAHGKEIKVALIQGNIDQPWVFRVSDLDYVIGTYENLTLSMSDEKPDLVIWPEYSIPTDLTQDKVHYERIYNLSKKMNSYIILGTTTMTPEAFNDKKFLIKKKTDSMVIFSPHGEIVGRYDTPLPMPFDKMVIKGENPYTYNIINTEIANFTIGICFEEMILERFRKKSDFIITLVNDQIFDDTPGTELISLFPSLIAAENKKYLLRSTNTGVTEIISPYGKVIYKLESFKEGTLIGKIYI